MTDKGWALKRTVQCAKCPWKVSTDPRTIPRGYSEEKHRALRVTIAEPGALHPRSAAVMACHEEHEAHCVGWLVNQLGPGNNIGLRLRMISCTNAGEIRTIGPQHETFDATLPKRRRAAR